MEGEGDTQGTGMARLRERFGGFKGEEKQGKTQGLMELDSKGESFVSKEEGRRRNELNKNSMLGFFRIQLKIGESFEF